MSAEEPLAIDGIIQRFGFTFELFWKALRRLLAGQGIEANIPKAVLQQAYRLGWLDREPRWLKLLEDRSLTSHTYREPLALEIYGRIPAHHAVMRGVSIGWIRSGRAEPHSIARTISSVIFLASPNSIMVLSL